MFDALLHTGGALRPFLPASLGRKIPKQGARPKTAGAEASAHNADAGTLRAIPPDACARWPFVLRIGGHLFDHAARACAKIAHSLRKPGLDALESGKPELIVAAKHRLPDAFWQRRPYAGASLDTTCRSIITITETGH